MSAVESYHAGREDFAALLEESFTRNEALEGTVIKGKVVAIEKDMAIIDVGLKTEGRVALKEFTGPGRDQELKVGDEVIGAVDVFELRPRIGLTSSALAQRIPDGERVRDLVLSAAYAIVGRWREEYDEYDVAALLSVVTMPSSAMSTIEKMPTATRTIKRT